MKQTDKKHYVAPVLTVATVRVEQGFAASGPLSNYSNHSEESWFGDNSGGGGGTSNYSNHSEESWF